MTPDLELPVVDTAPDVWGPDHDELALTAGEIAAGNADGETIDGPDVES